MRPAARGVSSLAIAAALVSVTCGASPAVEFRDIAGTWCTEVGRIQFDKSAMAVLLSGGRRSEFTVIRYEFAPSEVVVWWKNAKGEETYTKYGEFTSDATMVQESVKRKDGTMTERRALHRC